MTTAERDGAAGPGRFYGITSMRNYARWVGRRDPFQRTPDALFRQLDAEFGFTLDAAASDTNAKCPRYFTVDDDALGQDWGTEHVWLNPPYGTKRIPEFMRKAWEASRSGALVVALVPSNTDSAWWHDWAMKADEVRFIRGRVAFLPESGNGRASNAPFASSIVVFRPRTSGERVSLPLEVPA